MRVLCFIISMVFNLIITNNLFAAKAIPNNESKLTNYVYLGEFTKDRAQNVLKKRPPLDGLTANYSLQLYKINYQTLGPDKVMTNASGLVALPLGTQGPVGIVNYYHGTRFEHTDIPSNNNEKDYIYLATFGSSGGYMMVMPDYLGHGDSTLSMHPYVQADTLATSSVDMLLAAKELAQKLNYSINDELYLSGYSEGGFTTMVTFEMLQKNYPHLPVTAAAPGSAPYDWEETMNFIVLKPGPRATAYLAYFFYSMQHYKKYWSNLEEIFVKPYDRLIPQLYDGYHTMPEILEALPTNPLLIVRPEFINNILTGRDKNTEELLANFNHYDFTPNAPLLMVGTKGDQDVPFDGAEKVYALLNQKSHFVSILSVSDTLDHVKALPLVLKEQLEFFQQH